MSAEQAQQEIHVVSVDDAPTDTRRGGEIRPVLSPKAVGATSGFMGCATIAPNDWIAEHYHPYSEEFVMVMQGEIVAQLDGEDYPVKARQGVMIPMNVRHRLKNEGNEDAFFVFHMSPLAPRPELGHVDTEERE